MNNILITGASSGIGYEFAEIFAKDKNNLILVARNKEKLNEMKERLEKKYNIKVYVYQKDLSCDSDMVQLYNDIKNENLEVDILINNAGAGYVGEFIEESYKKDCDIMQLNMNALTYLTKVFAKDMTKRNGGKILNVASTGSYHPGPYTAVYYATKAYVLSLTEALREELKPYNVTVSALCPGATKSNFSKNAGKQDNPKAMSPKIVAEKAYKGLMKNKTTIIPGLQNKLLVLVPRKLALPFIGMYQKGLKNKK